MSTFPQSVALFQLNRRTKRNLQNQEQDKIFVNKIFGLQENKLIKQSNFILQNIEIGQKETFAFGLSKAGQVFLWGNFSVQMPLDDSKNENDQYQEILKYLKYNTEQRLITDMIPIQITYFNNVKIQMICCNERVAIFLSSNQNFSFDEQIYKLDEGTLYAWGDDSENRYGLLGLGQQFKAMRPCPNSYLFDYMIKVISISESHACAVDSNGRLFTWGYGPNGELGLEQQMTQANQPTIISKQKQINIKKAICHSTYTAFCSGNNIHVIYTQIGAGYAYFFGTLQLQIQDKMRQSSQKINFIQPSSSHNLVKSNSQIGLDQNAKSNLTQKQSNRPLNSMTQIISLNENFINDLVGGENFIIALTSNGDVFFVDDSLECVQINSNEIESLAVAGPKIVGLSKSKKLYEWSTSGLNKLSFNKENKLLLKQDFQIKEYQLKQEFQYNSKICNISANKNNVAIIFDDIGQIFDKIKQMNNIYAENQEEYELNIDNANQKITIAEQIKQGVQRMNFNPLETDSSINSSKDNNEMIQFNEPLPKESPTSPSEHSMTPSVSIFNTFQNNNAHNDQQLPSFKIPDENQQDYSQQQPSNFLSEKDINNIFNYRQLQVQPSQQQQQQPQQHQQQNESSNSNNGNIVQNNNQFFFEYDQNNFNAAYQYRPSSIKSYKQSQNKSQQSSFNNYSNSSLKQCHADMMPLCRNSKIEISFPSFLNLSPNQVNPQLHRNSNNSHEMIMASSSPQIQQTHFNLYHQNVTNQQFEIKIHSAQDESIISIKSRDSSLNNRKNQQQNQVTEQQQKQQQDIEEEVKEEETIEIVINQNDESFQIKAKKTQTPQRMLKGFSMNKRQCNSITPSEKNPIESNTKSEIFSQNNESELSNGFNLTTQSCRTREENSKNNNNKDRNTMMSQGGGGQLEGQKVMQQVQEIMKEQELLNTQRKYTQNKKLSHSCGSNNSKSKRASFIKAVLQQQQNKKFKFDINNTQTSVTQIYSVPPFQDSHNQQFHPLPDKISEEDVNLMMSSSNSRNHDVNIINASQSNNNNTSQLQINNIQYIYGDFQQNLNDNQHADNNQDVNQQRETIGVTHTEENIDVEYTISNTCTPNSNKSSSNIKRRINFDDSSQYNGDVIRMSDMTNNNKIIAQFKLSSSSNLQQQQQQCQNQQQTSEMLDIQHLKKAQPKLSLPLANLPNNINDCSTTSQNFIFEHCKSPIQQQQHIQLFNDENFISYMKENTTPSHQDNQTHIIMLTEEKFKNLKSEISQNDQQNQFLITQNTLLSSPMLNDFNNNNNTNINNLNRMDSKSQLYQNQVNVSSNNTQNISCFIKQNKYLQVYENFRKGFIKICKIRDLRRSQSLRKIKKYANDQKQRKEFLQGMARFLFNTLKNNITLHKQIGFKRIKKFYKERQLQVYIRRKQNEFALKTSVLVKIDQIINSHNIEEIKQSYQIIKNHFIQIKKAIAEKKNKSSQVMFNFLIRKSKNTQEKALRCIVNIVNEKKIIEMQTKMITRVITKIVNSKFQQYFKQMKNDIKIIAQRKEMLQIIQRINLKNELHKFCKQTKIKYNKQKSIKIMQQIIQKNNQKQNIIQSFRKLAINRQQLNIVIKLTNLLSKRTQIVQQNCFSQINQIIKQKKIREKLQKVQKALLLLLFTKISDLVKSKLRLGFQNIAGILRSEETLMIAKSLTSGNLSFSLNSMANDPSLILTKNQNNHNYNVNGNNNYYVKENIRKVNRNLPKGLAKSNSQVNQKRNQQIIGVRKQKQTKPALNDYLSFSPQNFQNTQNLQDQNKFQFRRNTEANSARIHQRNQFVHHQQPEKQSGPDCPIPQQQLQQQQMFQKKIKSRNNQQIIQYDSSSQNKLNVSIKDMNQAFKDQVSRIKERQDTDENSSSQSQIDYKESIDGRNKMHDENNYTQTPDELIINDLSYINLQRKTDGFQDRSRKNRSPNINPLCTSESYYLIQGYNNNNNNQNQNQPNFNCIQKQSIDQVSQNQQPFNQQQQIDQQMYNNKSKLQLKNLEDMNSYNIQAQDCVPKTSTFGHFAKEYDENVQGSSEDKFSLINKTDQPMTFREQQQKQLGSQLKKGDPRYQRLSCLEQDFSMDFDQMHQMFDEFDMEEKEQQIIRLQNTNYIGTSQVKTSLADLSRKIDLTQILAQEYNSEHDESCNQFLSNFNHNRKNKKSLGGGQIQFSPKFTDNYGSQFNRDQLQELANFQMMELTPEGEFQMLLTNKSICHKEESIYSNNQYAEPVEMTLSPRITNNQYAYQQQQMQQYKPFQQQNKYQQLSTIQTQVNYYSQTLETQNRVEENVSYFDKSNLNNFNSKELDDQESSDMDNNTDEELEHEISQIIQHGREETRPYNFQLSSNGKYNTISEDQTVKNILKSEITQPMMVGPGGQSIATTNAHSQNMDNKNICKKLSFGNEQLKKPLNYNFSTSRGTSNGLFQKCLTTQPSQMNSNNNSSLSGHFNSNQHNSYTNNNSLQQVKQLTQCLSSRTGIGMAQSVQRSFGNIDNWKTQDFIAQNINRLKNIVKPSPRYQK